MITLLVVAPLHEMGFLIPIKVELLAVVRTLYFQQSLHKASTLSYGMGAIPM
jgi:hypothetical protein